MSILRVLSAEGIDCEPSFLGCYITHNNTLQDIITPLTSEHSVSLPLDGIVKITLKTMSEDSKVIGSVVFPLEIVTRDQFWLPLTSSVALTSIPDEAELPRIEISIENAEHSCELSPESNIITVSDDDNDWSRLRLQLKMQSFSLQEMSFELSTVKNKLIEETSARQATEGRIFEIQKEFNSFVGQAQGREKSMLKLLEQKDLEIAESINQTLKLQGYLDRLLEDKRHVEEKLACLETFVANDETELLRQQVNNLKFQLNQEDKRRQEMQDMLLQIGKEWRETEDQEKINMENKLIKVEQEALRAKISIQSLQMDIEKAKNELEKAKFETQASKQENAVLVCEKEEQSRNFHQLQNVNEQAHAKIAELLQSINQKEREIHELLQEKEKSQQSLNELIEKCRRFEIELEKAKTDSESFEESVKKEQKTIEKLNEKIAQEKLYSNRLNDQVMQERLNCERIRQDLEGPSLESLVQCVTGSLGPECAVTKVENKYFYEGSELSLIKRVEFIVEVKTYAGNVLLSEYLTAPRTPSVRKRVSQDSRIENESFSSCFSIDKSLVVSDKKNEVKGKTGKIVLKNTRVLKERNSRTASFSVERRRPFK